MERLRKNKINISSKEDMLDILKYLVSPYLENKINQHQKAPMAFYEENIQVLEQFSRFLLGVGPYIFNRPDQKVLDGILNTIKDGINPKESQYWNITYESDNNQVFVEMFSLLFFLYMNKEQIPNSFFIENETNLKKWFLKINKLNYRNNWIWFKILVNVILYKLELIKYDYNFINEMIHIVDSQYYDRGIYRDGAEGQIDYYNSFSFHFYSLIYVKLMKEVDIENCNKFIERAKEFSIFYVNYFSDDGRNIPYGRSLIYRFGVLAFWGVSVFSGEKIIELGYAKDIICKNLSEWLEQDIYYEDGYLNAGYYYNNFNILENYNAYGSVYWCLKVFILLYLKDNEEFWKIERKDFSNIKSDFIDKKVNIYQATGESYLVPIIEGMNYRNFKFSDKYEKFVYSTLFGFNVTLDNTYQGSAFDSNIAISYDGDTYLLRKNIKSTFIKNDVIKSIWNVDDFSYVISYQVFDFPWSIRVHFVYTTKNIFVVEGGFPINSTNIKKFQENNLIYAENDIQISGISSVIGNGLNSFCSAAPNTNVFYPKTVIPITTYNINKGKHIVATIIFGDKGKEMLHLLPNVHIKDNKVTIKLKNKVVGFEIDEQEYVKNVNREFTYLNRIKKMYKYIKKNI